MLTEKGKYIYIPSLLLIAILLIAFESDFLFRIQEQNLFLHTPLFFQQHMTKAGGLLTWAGCYLSQFFYYPILGTGILCLLWLFLMWMLQRAFRIPSAWRAVTLIPVACLVLSITTLGYWVYYLKLPGYAFDATIGSIVAVGLAWLYRIMPRRYGISTLFIVLATCLSYPLFGFYGLWATLLMVILAWHQQRQRLTDISAALLSIILIPLLGYHFMYHETNIVNIYWTALPVFAMHQVTYFAYNLPYIVLVASVSLMAWGMPKKEWRGVQVATWVVTLLCIAIFWYKDGNFHRELSMQRSIEQQDWEQVLKTAKATKGEPTRAMCMMQNLALYRLGRMGNEMFKYPNGAKHPDTPLSVRTVHTQGKLLYLHYGVPNYCHRWCVEDGVEYGWSVEKLKLMAKCALLNREPMAAMRFVNLLSKTDFNKDWAKRYREYIQNPALVYRDRELGPILPLMHQDNFLTGDQSQLEMFLVEQILSSPIENGAQAELARLTQYYYRNNRFKIVER